MKARWSLPTIISLALSIIAIVGVVSLALVSCATPGEMAGAPAQYADATVSAPGSSSSAANLRSLQDSFRTISLSVSPSVVRIDVRERVTQDGSLGNRPFFDFFFGQPDDEEPGDPQFERDGIGSGVIVSQDGRTFFVLTNDHVVGSADTITVILSDGSEFEAELVGRDSRKDLAMVSFRSERAIPVANLGDSDLLQVGDWVVAIGSPFGYRNTVTAGIVSAVERRGGPDGNISDFIQTDASINQGNSGGALVNLDGEVVGINTWITTDTGGSIGLGFAIPINNALRSIDEFLRDGEVEYGWHGVSIQNVERNLLDALELQSRQGALVSSVFSQSPADEAGILPGDVIVEIGQIPVRDSDELILIVGDLPINEPVEVRLIRQGEPATVTVRIAVRETESAIGQQSRQRWPGISVFPITDEIREELGISIQRGVIISAVDRGSPSDIGGLRSLDIVTAINGEDVRDLLSFYEIISDADAKEWRMSVLRDGETTEVTVVR